ncbi:MAG: hypothetical protein ACRCXM_17425 [Beijerinckiaceae bacterium]
MVGVERLQHRIAILRRRAEQFANAIDEAIIIVINRQHAVIGADPARALGKSIAVVIEINIRRASFSGNAERREFDAIAIEIEDEGVTEDRTKRSNSECKSKNKPCRHTSHDASQQYRT